MRNFINRTTIWIVLALPAGMFTASPLEACWLRDMFTRRAYRQAYYPTYTYAYPVTTNYCPSACGNGCDSCAVPQTSYRSVLSPVPVTTFQPVTVGGGTYLQPCATTSYQVQRAPSSNYLAMPTWTTPATTGCSSCGYAPATSAYAPASGCANCAPTLSGYASASQFSPAPSCSCSGDTNGSAYPSTNSMGTPGVSATPWTPVSPSEANGMGSPNMNSVPADTRPDLSATPSSPMSVPYQQPTVSYTDTGYSGPPAPWYPLKSPDRSSNSATADVTPPFRPIPDPRPNRPRIERSPEPDAPQRNLFPSHGEIHTAARPTARFEAVPIRWEVRREPSDDVGIWRSLAE